MCSVSRVFMLIHLATTVYLPVGHWEALTFSLREVFRSFVSRPPRSTSTTTVRLFCTEHPRTSHDKLRPVSDSVNAAEMISISDSSCGGAGCPTSSLVTVIVFCRLSGTSHSREHFAVRAYCPACWPWRDNSVRPLTSICSPSRSRVMVGCCDD